jgi:hypothetical protein
MFQSRERVMTGMMYTRLGRLAILYRHNLGIKALEEVDFKYINKNKLGRRNGGPFRTEFMGRISFCNAQEMAGFCRGT